MSCLPQVCVILHRVIQQSEARHPLHRPVYRGCGKRATALHPIHCRSGGKWHNYCRQPMFLVHVYVCYYMKLFLLPRNIANVLQPKFFNQCTFSSIQGQQNENYKILTFSTGMFLWRLHFYPSFVSSDSLCPPTKPTLTQGYCYWTTCTACFMGASPSAKWQDTKHSQPNCSFCVTC